MSQADLAHVELMRIAVRCSGYIPACASRQAALIALEIPMDGLTTPSGRLDASRLS